MLHSETVSIQVDNFAIHGVVFANAPAKEQAGIPFFWESKPAKISRQNSSLHGVENTEDKNPGTIIHKNILAIEEELITYRHVINGFDALLQNIVRDRAKGQDRLFDKATLLGIQKDIHAAVDNNPLNSDITALKERIDSRLTQIHKAADKLVRTHAYIAESQARKFHYSGFESADLVQEGTLGLLRAAYKFDPAKGGQFSTYASWWVRQSINRAIQYMTTCPRLPGHIVEKKRIYRQTVELLRNKYDREPSLGEICRKSGLTAAQVNTVKCCSNGVTSLDEKLCEDGSARIDMLADTKAPTITQNVEQNELLPAIEAALKSLPAREEQILRLRFGIGLTGEEHTLFEIGELLGVSRERVRQIEIRAQRILRHAGRGLSIYLD